MIPKPGEKPFSVERLDEKNHAFARLLQLMDDLRANCPWDRKQTFESLRNLTIEETYELADAILQGDMEGIKEEVGDLMLHLVFYAKIAEEQGLWDIASALEAAVEKLVARHPHVYGNIHVSDEAEVKKNWEQLKLQEGKKGLLAGVPRSLPAMVKAWRMQQKTAQVGFEWEKTEQVWEKVEEELAELRQAIAEGASHEKVEEEFGDVLFALINYARFLDIEPETALERVNQKFKQRFEYIEKHAPRDLRNMTLEEMDQLWNAAKRLEPGNGSEIAS
ncbi:MAG: nucleoside triphosphate pyrophosphohydrolase [Saprospiraceae bacterium]|nr:MAG: nucleoside triphosphate pyrophosphohydrolase [Saprospiraceae bacterium]